MITRNITYDLIAALGDSPVVFIHGARQTGKTTLVKWLSKSLYPARYITFDDAGMLAAARNDPAGFLSGMQEPLIIDEVQRVPELFLAIKAEVDRERRPGRFLMTGSADVLLLPRLSESMAGRMEILTLWPLSQGEIEGRKENFVDLVFNASFSPQTGKPYSKLEYFKRIVTGGYPEILTRASSKRKRAWFGSYITTILQRDIRDLANIEGLTELPRLLSLLAIRATSLLNFSEISRSLGMPQSTLKRYITLMETTFLIHSLPAWSGNLGKRLVKSPKLLVSDTGLMSYLLGLGDSQIAAEGPTSGILLEDFVMMELYKQINWSDTLPKMFHFRTQIGQEVDIVLEDASGRVVGIEIKASTTPRPGDFKGLKVLADSLGKRFVRGLLLYLGRETIPFGAKLHALPVGSLWSEKVKGHKRKVKKTWANLDYLRGKGEGCS